MFYERETPCGGQLQARSGAAAAVERERERERDGETESRGEREDCRWKLVSCCAVYVTTPCK